MKPGQLLGRLAVLVGATGVGVAIALPGFAQVGQSPNRSVQPNTTQPNTTQPNTPQSSPTQPDLTQPNTTPNTTQPNTTQPSLTQPNTTPNTTQPNTPQSSPTQSSPTQPSPTPNSTQPNPSQPGNRAEPGAAAPSSGTQTTSDRYLSELLQQVSSAGSFTTLAQAVEASGLTNSLRSHGGEFTILAPTDDAFAAIPQDKLQRLLQPENRALLQRVLAYHVIPGRVTSDQLQTGALRTLGGGVAVRVTPERVVINNGSVLQSDIPAQNGVVHAVSQVLMPQELREQILAL